MPAPPGSQRLVFDVSLDDLVALNLHVYDRSPVIRRKVKHACIALCGGLVMVFTGIALATGAAALIVAGAALAMIFWQYIPRAFRRNCARTAQRVLRAKGSAMLGSHELTATAKGLTDRVSPGRSSTPWRDVERIAEASRHVYIFTNRDAAYVIPRAAVAEGDLGAFVGYATEAAKRSESGRRE